MGGELEKWLHTHREKGHSDEDLKNALKNHGYQDHEIHILFKNNPRIKHDSVKIEHNKKHPEEIDITFQFTRKHTLILFGVILLVVAAIIVVTIVTSNDNLEQEITIPEEKNWVEVTNCGIETNPDKCIVEAFHACRTAEFLDEESNKYYVIEPIPNYPNATEGSKYCELFTYTGKELETVQCYESTQKQSVTCDGIAEITS